MTLTPKNWESFQHYKDRSPAWIKLHRGLLDDYAFSRLPVASRALAPMLWLLASEYEKGKITAPIEELAYRLRISVSEMTDAIKPLIDSGFFISDSEALARRYQPASLEREERRGREEKIQMVAVATPCPGFEEFKREYPKRGGSNPWKPAFALYEAARKRGHEHGDIIAGVRAYRAECERNSYVNTEKVAQARTWLSQERWVDYLEAARAEQSAIEGLASKVLVKCETPQWDAWQAYLKATQGKGSPRSPTHDGWHFPTEWPPEIAAQHH